MGVVFSPAGNIAILAGASAAAGHGGGGSVPTMFEVVFTVAVTVVGLWAVCLVGIWLMNLTEGRKPDTLVGVLAQNLRFIGRAVRHIW